MTDDTPQNGSTDQRTAGAFDIRFVIATLIGAYGVILTVYGAFFTSEAQIDKADGFHVNLWGGLGLIVVAAAFVAWGRLRPVVFRESEVEQAREAE